VSIRADLELWNTFGGQALATITYFPELSSATIARLTIGVYFRSKYTGWVTR
jgi:hypothetical protein